MTRTFLSISAVSFALLASQVLVGCPSEDPADDDDVGVDDDDATDDDDDSTGGSDDDDDSTGGSDDDDAVSPPCLAFHGAHSANTTWNYSWTNPQWSGGLNKSLFEYDYAANTMTMKTDESWSQSGASGSGTTYEYLYCDEAGLWITSSISDSSSNIMGNTTAVHVEKAYDEPAFLRPNMPSLNDSWTVHSVGTTTRDDGSPPQAFDTSVVYTVTEEDITEPPFNSQKFQSDGVEYYLWQLGFGVTYYPSRARLTTFTPQ